MKLNCTPLSSRGLRGAFVLRTALLFMIMIVLTALPANAQIARLTLSKPVTGGVMIIGNDVSYDPGHQVYLVVGGYGPMWGVFVNTAGDPVTAAFRIGSADDGAAFGHYPRADFSQHVNSGQGGFIVAWHQQGHVHAAIVAYPFGVISAEQVLSDASQGGSYPTIGAGIAYSPTLKRFLVVWTSNLWGTQGRLVDINGTPVGGVLALVAPGNNRDPSVAWNPATGEWGLGFAGWSGATSFVGFQRLRGSDAAALMPQFLFGFAGGNFTTDMAVNASGNYVMGWSLGQSSRTAVFSPDGTLIGGPSLVAARIGTPTSFSLAYNAASGTILAVSEDNPFGGTREVAAAEMNASGVALGAAIVASDGAKNGSFVPRVAARSDAKHWNISYSRDFAAATNAVVATSSGGPPPPPPAPPRRDITIYRPSEGMWYMLTGASNFTQSSTVRWGLRGDLPLQADFDGDKKQDFVVYRPTTGAWDILYSSSNHSSSLAGSFIWGAPGDVPVAADYTGDGKTDLAVWRPLTGTWYIYDLAKQVFTSYSWGVTGDTPLAGDFDGDGKADLCIYRPSNGGWYIYYSSNQSYKAYFWGASGDIPVPADYNGDTRTDITVYRPSNGNWYVLDALTGTYLALYQWGNSSYAPVPRDYDGDGRTDLGIFSPSTGAWYIYFVGSGTFSRYTWGGAGDFAIY